MQTHGKFMQTKGACIVKDPPFTQEQQEESKDVLMKETSADKQS